MTDKDFEIEIQDEQENVASGVQLPLNFLTFGEIETDDVKVYIKQSTYKALEKLASSDTTKELGSILIGQYAEEMGKTHVMISDYVEAKYTDASASTLTFTHETWDYVHKEHDRKYPDKKIIGWQHTHPNYGIFLSNYDMFIQENFFNMPSQVAYVIDPIQNIRGFFQWKNGKIEKLKGYYIYDDIGKPIKIEQTRRKQEGAVSGKPSRITTALLVLLCLLSLFLSWRVFTLNRRYQEQLSNQSVILSQLEQQEAIADQQAGEIGQLRQQLGESQTTVGQLREELEANRKAMEEQAANLRELEEILGVTEEGGIRVITYTVVDGDTLYGICMKNGIDFHASLTAILRLNKMNDPNMIYVGQVLYLPISE